MSHLSRGTGGICGFLQGVLSVQQVNLFSFSVSSFFSSLSRLRYTLFSCILSVRSSVARLLYQLVLRHSRVLEIRSFTAIKGHCASHLIKCKGVLGEYGLHCVEVAASSLPLLFWLPGIWHKSGPLLGQSSCLDTITTNPFSSTLPPRCCSADTNSTLLPYPPPRQPFIESHLQLYRADCVCYWLPIYH